MATTITIASPAPPVLQSDTFEIQRQKINNLAAAFTSSGATIQTFTSTPTALTALSASGNYQYAHGLSGKPQFVRWVVVCTSAAGEFGYAQNDEISVDARGDADGGWAFSQGADATYVFYTKNSENAPHARKKTNGDGFNVDTAKWSLKCYAMYITNF